MLIADREEISYVGVPPQPQPLRVQIKQSYVVGTVFVPINLPLSVREEAGFAGMLSYPAIRTTLHW